MFNFGFSELIVIGIIALLFIKPENLPGAARTVGQFLNELKRAGEDALGGLSDAKTRAENFVKETEDDLNQSVNELPQSDKEKPTDDKGS